MNSASSSATVASAAASDVSKPHAKRAKSIRNTSEDDLKTQHWSGIRICIAKTMESPAAELSIGAVVVFNTVYGPCTGSVTMPQMGSKKEAKLVRLCGPQQYK